MNSRKDPSCGHYSLKGIILLGIIYSFNVFARDIGVVELGDGACWLRSAKEQIHFASFNDKTSLATTLKLIDFTNQSLIQEKLELTKKASYLALSYAFHCSGIGASIVVKSKFDDLSYCSWLYVREGKIQARNIGLILDEKEDQSLCEGVAPLEFLVGFKTLEAAEEFSEFNSYIAKRTMISKTLMKVSLKREYLGKEQSILEELRKGLGVKFVEFNNYQYPIGESVELK